jgi:acyl carrier protein
MNRDEIKKVVYQCLYEQFCNDKIIINLQSKPNDGEDEFIYTELEFDSLDMIEFTMAVERDIGHGLIIDDNIIDDQITLRKVIDYIDNKINIKDNKNG